MKIGNKIKQLRIINNLTQENLADRAELSKGFISQVERDLTSPSIATLVDILQCLGTNLKEFFNEEEDEQIIFNEKDFFVKENLELKHSVKWIVPNAQKNLLEPILMKFEINGESDIDLPHEGEEFGYVLVGSITIIIGSKNYKAEKGETFYFEPNKKHQIKNTGKTNAVVLWITTPPNF